MSPKSPENFSAKSDENEKKLDRRIGKAGRRVAAGILGVSLMASTAACDTDNVSATPNETTPSVEQTYEPTETPSPIETETPPVEGELEPLPADAPAEELVEVMSGALLGWVYPVDGDNIRTTVDEWFAYEGDLDSFKNELITKTTAIHEAKYLVPFGERSENLNSMVEHWRYMAFENTSENLGRDARGESLRVQEFHVSDLQEVDSSDADVRIVTYVLEESVDGVKMSAAKKVTVTFDTSTAEARIQDWETNTL